MSFLHIRTLSETPSASMSEGFKGCRSFVSEMGQNVLSFSIYCYSRFYSLSIISSMPTLPTASDLCESGQNSEVMKWQHINAPASRGLQKKLISAIEFTQPASSRAHGSLRTLMQLTVSLSSLIDTSLQRNICELSGRWRSPQEQHQPLLD